MRKYFISCPKCDNPQLLEVIDRAGDQQDIEVCLCGFPEGGWRVKVSNV
jgi:hypothetical protein